MITHSANSSVDPSQKANDFSSIVEWVATSGVLTVVRANVVHAMHLGQQDILVHERGFRAIGDEITHVFAVCAAPRDPNIVFIARVNERSGRGSVWGTSKSGELKFTVLIDSDIGAQLVPNAGHGAEFEAEKNYFFDTLRSAIKGRNTRGNVQMD